MSEVAIQVWLWTLSGLTLINIGVAVANRFQGKLLEDCMSACIRNRLEEGAIDAELRIDHPGAVQLASPIWCKRGATVAMMVGGISMKFRNDGDWYNRYTGKLVEDPRLRKELNAAWKVKVWDVEENQEEKKACK